MAEKRKYTKKSCKYKEMKVDYIDYKDVKLLKHSLSERFKIMPRRLTGNSKDAQDMVELAIKRARHMAIIPFIASKRVIGQAIEDMEQ